MELKGKISEIALGWLILFPVVLCGFLIYRIPSFNLVFLIAQVLLLGAVVYYSFKFSFWQISLSRILLGCLFVFSGFVKGMDPVGTQYRIEDYFFAFGTEWAIPFALPLSVTLNATEFLLGVLLLLNVCKRVTLWFVMLMMVFFTAITVNDAMNNPVPDCGCFGDILKLTNWQTFYKNLVIDSLMLIVFLSRKRIRGWFNPFSEWAVFIVTLAAFVWFQVYNIRHLPVFDTGDWKPGKSMINPDPRPLKYYLQYRNKATGEVKEYLSPDYPFSDSVWMSQWEFVRQRVDDPNPRIHNLKIEDESRTDYTPAILENPGYQFLLVSFDLSSANAKGMEKSLKLFRECEAKEIDFTVLTASIPDDVALFKSASQFTADFYYCDDIELKSVIRSNPGLILMKNGVVSAKWHYHDIPTLAECEQKFGL